MLTYLRNKGNSLILKCLLAFVALTFVTWGGFSLSDGPNSAARIAVQVDDSAISIKDFEARYSIKLEAMKKQLGPLFNEELVKKMGLRNSIFSNMIIELLQINESKRLGISISKDEVRAIIEGMPHFNRSGKFDSSLYFRLLDSNRVTPKMFEEDIENQLTLKRLKNYVGLGVSVTEEDILESYRYDNDKITIQYIDLGFDLFEKKISTTNLKIKEFYEKNKEKFREDAKRNVRWWYLAYDAVKSKIKITESEIKARYSQTRQRYKVKGKAELSQIFLKTPPGVKKKELEKLKSSLVAIRKRIVKGESFAAMAKEYSQGPAAKKGGVLGIVSEVDMLPEIRKSLANMKKGGLSIPIKSSFGFHLLFLKDRKKERLKNMEEVRSQVRNDLLNQKAPGYAKNMLEKIRYAFEDKKKLPEVGILVEGESGFFEKKAPPMFIPDKELLSDLAFSLPEERKISPEKKGKNGVMFVSLLGKRNSAIPQFRSILSKVKKKYLLEQGAKLAKEESGKYLKELSAGNSSLEKISKNFEVEISNAKKFSRSSVPKFFQGNRKEISILFSLGKNKFGNVLLSDKFVLYKVLRDPESNMKNFDKQKAEIRKRVLEEKKNLLYNRYLESLRKSSKIMVGTGFKL